MRRLEFWYDFASTYSYPAAMRIESAAKARSVDVEWRPFLLGPIFRALGMNDSPFNLYPVKGRYMIRDLTRLCAELDLPFALPTAVSGIALTTLYAPNGWLGRWLEPLGIKPAFSPLGVLIALTFIGLPFVVRTLQPALEELEAESEEAAASLGANRWQTFRRVILPAIMPALLTGFALSFARALGEYGSVVFISGNMPMKTEITTLLIVTKLEQYDTAGATAIAVVMLVASFVILFAINALQWWTSRGYLKATA